ncbi:hypothetical protein [Rhodococcus sp. ACS1]|uniref:hypothetical protein n=1 Tax=Rhodococcus sp. ACS1 TaxID=2028570 RepID=UPI00211CB0B5|nr:hypothetical protein [Rhodococcus sp. ACS1]
MQERDDRTRGYLTVVVEWRLLSAQQGVDDASVVVALCGEQVHRVEFVRRDHFTQDAVIGVADAGKGKAETGLAGTDGGVQFLGEDVESDLPAAHVLAQQQSFGDSLGAALDDFS